MTLCLDDPSSHKLATRQFDPHYPSTQQTICCDNLPLWHSSTYSYMIRPSIFRSPRLQGGLLANCDTMSTLPKMLCYIMSALSWSEIWTVCHKIVGPICDVLQTVWRHVDTLSQDFFQHVCDVQPAFQWNVDVLLHDFLTFVISCRLLSEMWTFCHRIFFTRLQCPASFSVKCGRFAAWFQVTFVTSE